jgi:hypothetical protein
MAPYAKQSYYLRNTFLRETIHEIKKIFQTKMFKNVRIKILCYAR